MHEKYQRENVKNYLKESLLKDQKSQHHTEKIYFLETYKIFITEEDLLYSFLTKRQYLKTKTSPIA